MADLFDVFESKKARNEALKQVAENSGDFMGRALDAIFDLPSGSRLTGENIRRLLIEKGIVPHHHNAWGSLIKTAISRKWLLSTGDLLPMESVRSHSRKTPVYIRL